MTLAPSRPVFRLAVPADALELARMRWDASPEEVARSGQDYSAFCEAFVAFVGDALASGDWAIWVAAGNDRLQAHVYVRLIRKAPRPGRFGATWGYVTSVYTEPVLRNRGLGSELLRHVVAWAREQNLEFLLLWPSERSVPFYLRAGFGPSPDALELSLES
jgi:GNAT superfamily N-acetyltransferase